MSDEKALLAAILAQPDEDTPRLLYADWLDENARSDNDRGHAEFIRRQIADVALPGTYWNVTGRSGAPTRFKMLLGAGPWLYEGVMKSVRQGSGYVQPSTSSAAVLWRRGFIEGVICSGTSFGPTLQELRRHPIREIRLQNELSTAAIRRLKPDWNRSNLYAYELPDAIELLKELLSGPGGFPHLIHTGFEFGPISKTLCPFALAAFPKNHSALDVKQSA